MMPITDKERFSCHFEGTDKLNEMLSNKRMLGRYGLRNNKYSRVLCKNYAIWSVNPNFVALLAKRYGNNITFQEAVDKWEMEK